MVLKKVLIGTLGPREAFLDGAKGRAAKNSVLTSGAKQLEGCGAKLTRVCVPRTVKEHEYLHCWKRTFVGRK